MSINVDWSNPYRRRDGEWLKGNLHTHTAPGSGCGKISVEDCVNRYAELGYDFLSISDHCAYTRCKDPRIVFIPGVEWNDAGGHHAGVYSLAASDIRTAISQDSIDGLLETMAGTNALVVLNHPNWQMRPHYRREELESYENYDGIEIYNAVIERLQGSAYATDKWDYLLARDKRVLGFASEDSHRFEDIGLAAIYVRSKSRAPRAILSAIKNGNFYCSSGAIINDIRVSRGIIEIETPDAQEIHVRADGGKRIHRAFDRSIRFDTRGLNLAYVRFAVYGRGAAMAWTQPFFLKQQTDENVRTRP